MISTLYSFISAAVIGVSSYSLPGKLLPIHRNNSVQDSAKSGDKERDTLNLDWPLPSKDNIEVIHKMEGKSVILTLEVLHTGLSHGCFNEDEHVVVSNVLPFL